MTVELVCPTRPSNSRQAAPNPQLAVQVRVVEATAGLPSRARVTVRRDAAGVLDHPRQVQQVPGHEGGVAVGEVVLRPARPGIEIGGAWPGLADPRGVGLRRNDVP